MSEAKKHPVLNSAADCIAQQAEQFDAAEKEVEKYCRLRDLIVNRATLAMRGELISVWCEDFDHAAEILDALKNL